MPKRRNGSKGDSNPGSVDCESSILPLRYRASHVPLVIFDQICVCLNHLSFVFMTFTGNYITPPKTLLLYCIAKFCYIFITNHVALCGYF